MARYSLTVCASVLRDRLEVEIHRERTGEPPEEVALVYRGPDGWETDYGEDAAGVADDEGLTAAIAKARYLLAQYVDRTCEEPPEGLTAAGMAAWLMERRDDLTE